MFWFTVRAFNATQASPPRYIPFPLDMLRYDNCRACEQEDTHWIEYGLKHPELRAEVLLQSEEPPTVARWESFGWAVTECREGKTYWNSKRCEDRMSSDEIINA